MSYWDIYILVVIIIYLGTFFLRNLKTYFSIKASIRGKSLKLTVSLALSTIIYLIVFGILFYPDITNYLVKLAFIELDFLKTIGYMLILLALLTGLEALFEMKNSWRVGIMYDQKTELVTTGIYSLSRNPYFLSYDLLFAGILLIFPSVILCLLIIGLVIVFHQMILEEEAYLEKVHGAKYSDYKHHVNRYINLF